MDKNRSVVKIAAYKGERKKEMKKIGFIGVGIMGKSMVRNLMKAGYELHIYARTKAKVEDVIGEGAIFHETISECVKDCEAVITIVGCRRSIFLQLKYFGQCEKRCIFDRYDDHESADCRKAV